MKILITGISGFLSINMVRHLLQKGYTDISGIDLVDFDYPERDKIKFLQGDIRDREAVKSLMPDVDVVIHILQEDLRTYYDIEGMWFDAKRIRG